MADSGPLGRLIHDLICGDGSGCTRWRLTARHRDYYNDCAAAIQEKLAPEIWQANVALACQAILEELM